MKIVSLDLGYKIGVKVGKYACKIKLPFSIRKKWRKKTGERKWKNLLG